MRIGVRSTWGGGKPLRQLIPTMTTLAWGPWKGPPWTTRYFPWYLVAPSLPLVAPPNWKSFPYPIYCAWTDPNAHVWVFQKAVQANGESNDLDVVNLFCFTLKDAILEWGDNFMSSHLGCTFVELEVAFCKWYQKVQTYKQVYMALRIIKQTSNEKVEVHYEHILKLAKYLNHKTNDSLFTRFF